MADPTRNQKRHEKVLRKLVMAWDADDDELFDDALAVARQLLGLSKADKSAVYRCVQCDCAIASPGLCGECACEDDSSIW